MWCFKVRLTARTLCYTQTCTFQKKKQQKKKHTFQSSPVTFCPDIPSDLEDTWRVFFFSPSFLRFVFQERTSRPEQHCFALHTSNFYTQLLTYTQIFFVFWKNINTDIPTSIPVKSRVLFTALGKPSIVWDYWNCYFSTQIPPFFLQKQIY